MSWNPTEYLKIIDKVRKERKHFTSASECSWLEAEEQLFIWPENTAEIPDSFMVNRGKFSIHFSKAPLLTEVAPLLVPCSIPI